MEYLILGFFTGLSLILAIGAQNIFVIEQGLKKQHIFLICFVCSISDLILIFLGIFLFHYFIQYFNSTIELIFNILLIIFLVHFINSILNSLSNLSWTISICNGPKKPHLKPKPNAKDVFGSNSKVNFNSDIKDVSKSDIL